MISILTILLMCLHSVHVNILIRSHDVNDDRSNETITLKCDSQSPWFLCSITLHSISTMICAVKSNQEINRIPCNHEDLPINGTAIFGNDTECGVSVLLKEKVRNTFSWDCTLSSYENGNVMIQEDEIIRKSIVKKGSLRLSISIKNMKHMIYEDEDRNLSFDVELGQTVNISCLFENGFPKPDFNWTDEAGNEIASFPEHLSFDNASLLYESSSQISFLFERKEMTFYCIVNQDNFYQSTTSIRLVAKTDQRRQESDNTSDLIIGLLTTLNIFLVISCVSITMVMCRKERILNNV